MQFSLSLPREDKNTDKTKRNSALRSINSRSMFYKLITIASGRWKMISRTLITKRNLNAQSNQRSKMQSIAWYNITWQITTATFYMKSTMQSIARYNITWQITTATFYMKSTGNLCTWVSVPMWNAKGELKPNYLTTQGRGCLIPLWSRGLVTRIKLNSKLK